MSNLKNKSVLFQPLKPFVLNFLKLNVQNSDEMQKIGNVWDLDLFTMKQKSEKIVSKVGFYVFKNILQVEKI